MAVLDRRRSRGVTPIVGLIVLLGIVSVAAIGLFVVGASLTQATQDAAEDRQTIDSFEQFSAEVDRIVGEETDTGEFVIDGREGAVTAVEPSAGHVEVMMVENGSTSTIYSESLGAVRYEASGTEFAYQAGGVWRTDSGNRSVMVDSPRFSYRTSPTPTLSLPVISVRGSATESGDFDGTLSVANRSDVYPAGPGHQNPLRADRVIVDVESSYCTAWSTYVDGQTDGQVVEQCHQTVNTSTGELRVDLPVADLPTENATDSAPVNTTVDVVPPSSTPGNATNASSVDVTGPVVTNGTTTPSDPPSNVTADVDAGSSPSSDGRVYGLYVEEDVSLSSIGGQIQGSLGSGGTFTGSASGLDMNGTIDGDVTPDRSPHDDEIEAILEESSDADRVKNFCGSEWASCEFSGPRTIVVDESEFNGGGGEVEFDVSSGDITLLVDGDLETNSPTSWEVTGHESGNSLDVYTTGDLSIGGNVYTTPDSSLNPFQPVQNWDDVKTEEYHPESLTFYAPSDSEIDVANGVRIEGSISAPGATATGTSMSHQQVGAMYVGEWDVDSASVNLYPAPGSYGQPVDGTGPSGPGTIEVSVVDNETGSGIQNAEIGISNDSGLVRHSDTDAAGDASTELSSGNYSLAIDHPDYHGTTVADVRVNPNATTTVDVPLPETTTLPDEGHLMGVVVNASAHDDPPLDGARVEVRYASNGTLVDAVQTASDGSYDVELAPGTYDVTVSDSEFDGIDPTTVSIDRGATTWANASLASTTPAPTTGSVTVEVFNGTLVGPDGSRSIDGTAVDGATVRLTHPNGTTVGVATTDSSGTVDFDDIETGTGFQVQVDVADYDSNGYTGVTVEPGGGTAVDVPMKPSDLDESGSSGRAVSDSKLYYLHVSETVIEVEN